MSLVSFSEVGRFYGRQDVLKSVTLSLEQSERVGLVGRNGAGKTTFIRLILDEEQPDSGLVIKSRGLKIGYLPQDILSQSTQNLLDLVLDTDQEYREVEKELKKTEELLALSTDKEKLQELAEKQSHLLHRFESLGGWAKESRAKKILSGLGFSETDFSRNMDQFSGGWIMRGLLARLLVAKPDLLILDEPTNHLDIDSLLWLENYLKSSSSALLLVSHDRIFLNNVTQKIIEIRNGKADSYQGNYNWFLEEKQRRLVTETAAYNNQQDKIRQMENFIDRNKVRASTAKRAQSRVKTLEKMDKIKAPEGHDSNIIFRLPKGRRGPDITAKLINVSKTYGKTEVFSDLNLTLMRGQRLALVGPNGQGKSTLIKLVLGLTPLSSGQSILGQNVDVGYFAQFQMDLLDPSLSVFDEFSKVAGNLSPGSIREILAKFLFLGEDVFKKVSVLSGGEKTRLVLAKIMVLAPNFLLLDEPTNHLDIPGRQMLEEALENFQGTIILISHDRHFINRLCDHIGVIENGQLTVHPGNFDDYQEIWLKNQEFSQKGKSPLSPEDYSADNKDPNKENKPISNESKRQQSAEIRKKESSRRKPLLKRISETETDLEQKNSRQKELEKILSDPLTYKDTQKAKELNQELSTLLLEKKDLELMWEKTMLEIEKINTD
jgi:ATP-binding cassette subfamily F protein 3